MGDYLPKYLEADALPLAITATVIGGQLVTAAGAVAGANETTWVGVASRDAINGDRITVYTGGVQRLIASGAIAIGDRVKCGAAGTVATLAAGADAYDRQVGIALEAAADTAELAVKLIR